MRREFRLMFPAREENDHKSKIQPHIFQRHLHVYMCVHMISFAWCPTKFIGGSSNPQDLRT